MGNSPSRGPSGLWPFPSPRTGPWLLGRLTLAYHPVFSSLLATVCFLRAFYYLAPLVSDLVAFLSSCINSFSCTLLLPSR